MNNTTIFNNSSLSSSSTSGNFSFVLPNPNKLWNYVDFIARCYDCLIHIIYFLYVAFKSDSDLRTRSCLFLNNINLATFSISILYVFYIPTRAPSFSDPTLNAILCTLTELSWSCLKYSRVLSLLLLAVYRYIGCFNVPLYKKINSRLIYILALIAISWLVSLIVPVIFKFALSTSYSTYYCTDGYVPDRLSLSIAYYAVNTVLSSVIPSIVIIVLYFKMYDKLKEQVTKTGFIHHHNHQSQISPSQSIKLAKFARQFIVINALTIAATVFSTFVEFVNVIAGYPSLNYLEVEFSIIRPFIRALLLVTESFVPVVSIYYTSWSWRSFKLWFLKRRSTISARDLVTSHNTNNTI